MGRPPAHQGLHRARQFDGGPASSSGVARGDGAAGRGMPGMGRWRKDLGGEPLRVWVVYSYLIVYRPETKPLQVIRVVSGHRDLTSMFE